MTTATLEDLRELSDQTVHVARTLVDGEIIENPPKTNAGSASLPLDGALVAALRAFKALQVSEKLTAGEA
jgi:hypothetical protein